MNFQTLFNNTTTKRDTLKPAFNVGEIPTQQHFYDMIDGLFLQDDTVYKDANNGLAIQAGTDANKTALLLYADATSEPAWQLGIANGFELKDTAGNTQLMVTNDGKVGVGTNNPAGKKLFVQGDTRLSGSAEVWTDHTEGIESSWVYDLQLLNSQQVDNTFSRLMFNSFSSALAAIGANRVSEYQGDLHFQTRNGTGYLTTKMHIRHDGNVGIGTTNPTVSLDILAPAVGGNEYMLQMKVSDAPSDYMKLGNVTAVPGQFIPAIVAHHDTDNRAALYLISSISPSSNNGTNPVMYFEARTAESPYTLPTSSTRPMFGWGSYNATKMVMMANGNVGIGTTNPSAMLDILAPASGQESMLQMKVSDASNDYFKIGNMTLAAGQFMPGIMARHDTDNREALFLTSYISTSVNNGSTPMMHFDARTAESPYEVPSSSTRPLFAWSSYASKKMVIMANGNVGIGITNPGNYRLYVDGHIRAEGNLYHKGIFNTSDIRLKKGIAPITTDSIAKLSQLQGNHYQWRTEEFKEKNLFEGTQLGFIAQDMQEIFPELVHKDSEGYLSINYTGLIPVLTEAHKQQQKTIESQQAQIDNLVARMVALENLLAATQS